MRSEEESPLWEISHASGFVVRNVTQLADKRAQLRRQRNGLPIQTGTKPLANFFADRRAMDASDPHATLVRAIRHEKSNLRQRKIYQPWRLAVTKRASGTFEPSPDRRHRAATCGQTSLAQFNMGASTCRRSLLAIAVDSLASTLGARADKATTEAPRRVNNARAEKDLNMVDLLTLVGLNPAAVGDSSVNSPIRLMFHS
jgi:hypothetical protein